MCVVMVQRAINLLYLNIFGVCFQPMPKFFWSEMRNSARLKYYAQPGAVRDVSTIRCFYQNNL